MDNQVMFPLEALASFAPCRSLVSVLVEAGLSDRTAARVVRTGAVPTVIADRVAVSLRVHPGDVWGWQRWIDSADEEPRCWCGEVAAWRDDRSCAASYCSQEHAQLARRRSDAQRHRRGTEPPANTVGANAA